MQDVKSSSVSPVLNISFIPTTISETGDPSTIGISQYVNVFFENLQSLTQVPIKGLYIIEGEVEATFTGDFDAQTLFPAFMGKGEQRSLGHNPSESLRQMKKDITGVVSLQDQVSVMLSKKKPAMNGTLKWIIPTFLFSAQRHLDKIALDPSEYPKYIAKNDLDTYREQFDLIYRINVVQQYVLENGMLTMMKHGSIQLQHNLNELGFNQAMSDPIVSATSQSQLLAKAESMETKEKSKV